MNELKNAEAAKAFKIKTETEQAKASAEALSGKTVKIAAKAGQGGKIFGSVTAKEIAEEIKKQYGVGGGQAQGGAGPGHQGLSGTYQAEVKVLYGGISTTVNVVVHE